MRIDKTIIDWVWVDLDDTLWDFTANSLTALGQLYETENLGRFFQSVDDWRAKYLECNHSLWPLYNAGKITKEYLQTERFRRVLDEAGYPAEGLVELCTHLDKEYLRRLGQLSLLVPGARDLLKYLRDSGYKVGLISNGFQEVQYNKMRSSGITDLIDVVVLSDEVGVNKPDIRIFEYAANKASTSPDRCLIIGDNHETDIIGGLSAGWQVIFFNRDNALNVVVPSEAVEISSLSEVQNLL